LVCQGFFEKSFFCAEQKQKMKKAFVGKPHFLAIFFGA